ncbi:MAG: hypothetical protein CL862_03015 [Cyanobium sp. NAT70]|nr:hypothetical protein [Cyanobium sp. NAT70]
MFFELLGGLSSDVVGAVVLNLRAVVCRIAPTWLSQWPTRSMPPIWVCPALFRVFSADSP